MTTVPLQRVGSAEQAQVRGLVDHRVRLDQHVAREQGDRARHERPAAELREGVMPAGGRDDVVTRLRAAIKADDQWRLNVAIAVPLLARQVIDDRALAAIAEGQIDDDRRATVAHSRRLPGSAGSAPPPPPGWKIDPSVAASRSIVRDTTPPRRSRN